MALSSQIKLPLSFAHLFAFVVILKLSLVHSVTLPFDEIETPCKCTKDGFSGIVKTAFKGCKVHLGNGPFCYVANPPACSSDTASERFPGATYVSCSHCVCAEDGVSNNVRTNRRGCALHVENKGPFCYIKVSKPCRGDSSSDKFPGAYYKSCSFNEALFFAARHNNVNSIRALKARGATLTISVNITFASGTKRTWTLAEYAAAYGSFKVMEELLGIEGNFNCYPGQDPRTTLCDLSDDAKCNRNAIERVAAERLLSLYERDCP